MTLTASCSQRGCAPTSNVANWAVCPGLTNDTCLSSGEQRYSTGGYAGDWGKLSEQLLQAGATLSLNASKPAVGRPGSMGKEPGPHHFLGPRGDTGFELGCPGGTMISMVFRAGNSCI